MVNYQHGKIYSIRSPHSELIYIGSTTRRLSERFGKHKSPLNRCSSKQVIDLGDAYIELVEEYPCSNKEDLQRREGQIIRNMICVNKQIAGRTKDEYYQDNIEDIIIKRKQYYKDNTEIIRIKQNQYDQDNKESIKNYRKQYYLENKEYLKTRKKQYYLDNIEKVNRYQLDNKESIKIRSRQYSKNKKKIRACVCGVNYNVGKTSDAHKHYKSQKHSNWVDNFYQRLSAI